MSVQPSARRNNASLTKKPFVGDEWRLYTETQAVIPGMLLSPKDVPVFFLTPDSEFSFHEMEAAKLALEKAHKQLESNEKPTTLAKLGFSRNAPSPRTTANGAVLNAFSHDFKSLQAAVERFETNWKGNQNKVSDAMTLTHRHTDASS